MFIYVILKICKVDDLAFQNDSDGTDLRQVYNKFYV